MPPLGPISRRTLIRGLRRLGFEGPYSGTRHQFMVRGALRLRIPDPHHSDISAELLTEILRQARISREEWERL